MSTHNAVVMAGAADSGTVGAGGIGSGGQRRRGLGVGLGARQASRGRARLWVAAAGIVAALTALSYWGPARVCPSATPGLLGGRASGAPALFGATPTGGAVAPGSTFGVVAAGFKPADRVGASLRGLGGSRAVYELGFSRASVSGTLQGTFVLPRDAKRGCYGLYLSGLAPGGMPLSDEVELCAT
ncbi:MAG: hypothetical protein ACP5VR_07030 [Acidimicrobiales bacterium]